MSPGNERPDGAQTMGLVSDGPVTRVHVHEDAIASTRRHRANRPASVGISPVFAEGGAGPTVRRKSLRSREFAEVQSVAVRLHEGGTAILIARHYH